MSRLFRHSETCKGPPCACSNPTYWVVITIASISALLEALLAGGFAGSGSAQADAAHSLSHVLLYYIAIRINLEAARKTTQEEICHIQEKYLGWGWNLFLLSLMYVVFVEAIPRLWQPTPIIANYMLLGVTMGLSGNILSRLVLKKMQVSFFDGGKTHAHKGEYHVLLVWDNLGDLLITLVVLTEALVLKLLPENLLVMYGSKIYRADAILTILIAVVVGWRGHKIFRKGAEHNH